MNYKQKIVDSVSCTLAQVCPCLWGLPKRAQSLRTRAAAGSRASAHMIHIDMVLLLFCRKIKTNTKTGLSTCKKVAVALGCI
jgi:hypothetical protein